MLGLIALGFSGVALADEGPTPQGVPQLNHVFLIMMENHGYGQIVNNPNAPFINSLAQKANLAQNYFAVGHPSLTNYLEVVGGSNFGVQSDNDPDWHNSACKPNVVSGRTNTDNPTSPNICPIAGVGTDAATPVLDITNETQGLPGLINIDGALSFGPAPKTIGKTIGDQLVATNKSWKSYQESLPISGADGVNYSDGFFTDSTDFTKLNPQLTPPLTQSNVVSLYAAKHDPFVYFQNVQQGTNSSNSLANVVGFDGLNGLWADLATGQVPNFAFIAPNQCNDQHGRGNAGAFCNFDPKSDGSQAGLNPALIYQGDVTVQRIVSAIYGSQAWKQGNNALIVMWDENDYSISPKVNNRVMVIVDTNYRSKRIQSTQFYTHFSLLKSLEGGFNLPCLNHACDQGVNVMTDMFQR